MDKVTTVHSPSCRQIPRCTRPLLRTSRSSTGPGVGAIRYPCRLMSSSARHRHTGLKAIRLTRTLRWTRPRRTCTRIIRRRRAYPRQVAGRHWGHGNSSTCPTIRTHEQAPASSLTRHRSVRWAGSPPCRTDRLPGGVLGWTVRGTHNGRCFGASSARRSCGRRTTRRTYGRAAPVRNRRRRRTRSCDRAVLASRVPTCRGRRRHRCRQHPGTIDYTMGAAMLGLTSGGAGRASRRAITVRTTRRTATRPSRRLARATRRCRG